MSHATLTVFLPGTLTQDQLDAELAKLMAPYDENLETPRYVKATKTELIAKERADFTKYVNGTYAEFTADPVKYAAECRNLRHLLYVAGGDYGLTTNHPEIVGRYMDLIAEMEETGLRRYERTGDKADLYTHSPMPFEESFPARFAWTNEEFYREAIRWYDESEIGSEGEVYSEYNPNSKWDWYVIGGRWAGYWKVLPAGDAVTSMTHFPGEGIEHLLGEEDRKYIAERRASLGERADVLRKMDVDFEDEDLYPATFALLDSEGVWHEKGEMGWFGMSHGDKEQDVWRSEYRELVAKEADNAWMILVDYHI